MTNGLFPIAWKHSIVTPVFKKGDVYDPGNYRPISLLPIISKIQERLNKEQLRAFFNSHGVISAAQHSIRRGYSCETALMSLSKHLFHLRDVKRFACVTAIDFSRTFDTVNHDILMSRIKSICDVNTAAWFRSYLCNRLQSVNYCNVLSDPRTVTSGTPQGSVLASTLFVLNIKSLLKLFQLDCATAYKDDVTVVSSGCTLADVISCAEDVLRQVQSWANDNGLVINPSKCNSIINSLQVKNVTPISISLHLGGGASCIKTVSELRLLGVTFTSDLKWSVHAANTRKSTSKMIGVINRLGNATNTNTRLRILQAFDQLKLTYCLPVWGHLTSSTAMDHALMHAARVVLRNKAAELSKPTFFFDQSFTI